MKPPLAGQARAWPNAAATGRTPQRAIVANWLPLVLGLGALALMFAVMHWVYPQRPFSYDELRYSAMASHLPVREYPYDYRVLIPWLVSVLPVPHAAGFAVITFLSLAATLWCLHLYLQADGLSPGYVLFALLLFATGYGVTFNLYHDRLIDPAAIACLSGGLVLMQRQKTAWFSLLLTIGVLCKESTLFLIPVYGWQTLSSRRFSWRQGLVVAPALVVFFGVRGLGLFGQHTSNYTWQQITQVFSYQTANYGSVGYALLVAIAASFGSLWLAAGLGWSRSSQTTRVYSLFLIFVAIQLVLGGDWIRMLTVAAPVLFPLALTYLAQARRTGLLVLLVAEVGMTASLVPQGMPLLYVPYHAVLVTGLVVLYIQRTRNSS